MILYVQIFDLSGFLQMQAGSVWLWYISGDLFKKKKIHCDKFIDNPFTHFGTLPEEILPASRVRLLSSTCHMGWVSPTSQGVAKWQLPMSEKMKPREGKKKEEKKKTGRIEISYSQVYQSDSCQHSINAEKQELFIFTAECWTVEGVFWGNRVERWAP